MICNLPRNNFINDKWKGKKGETAVKDFYNSNGYCVIDVSEDKTFQKADIDLIVNDKYVEVKTQSSIYKRNEITLEIEISYYDDLYLKGWFYSTEADILVFYDKENNIAYNIDTAELREIYQEFKEEFDEYYFDEDYKVSRLAYINIDLLKKYSKTLEILNYNFLTA